MKTSEKIELSRMLAVAEDDLLVSKLLYETGHFRSSYFHFQQASEKANKVLMMLRGATQKEAKKISHDQLKPFRKAAVEQVSDLAKFKMGLQLLPPILRRAYDNAQHENQVDSLYDFVSAIDSTRNEDLSQLNKADLEGFVEVLDEVKHSDFNSAVNDVYGLQKMLFNLVEQILPAHEEDEIKEAKEYFSDIQNVRALITNLSDIMKSFAFVQTVLLTTAFLTVQHSSKTRYPELEHDPMEFYQVHLPIVEFQPKFMSFLQQAMGQLGVLIETHQHK